MFNISNRGFIPNEVEFRMKSITQILGTHVLGFLEVKNNIGSTYPIFTAYDFVGSVYEKTPEHVYFKNGSRLTRNRIDQLIYELQKLKMVMDTCEMTEKLAKD